MVLFSMDVLILVFIVVEYFRKKEYCCYGLYGRISGLIILIAFFLGIWMMFVSFEVRWLVKCKIGDWIFRFMVLLFFEVLLFFFVGLGVLFCGIIL